MLLYILNTIFNDAPQPWQIGFQDSAAPGFTGIVELHNTIFFYLVVICVGVFWVLGSIIYYYNSKKSPFINNLNYGTLFKLFNQIYLYIVKFNNLIIIRYLYKLSLLMLLFNNIREYFFNNELILKFILYLTIINLFTFFIQILINIFSMLLDIKNFHNYSPYFNLFINVFLILGCISLLYKLNNLYNEYILFDQLFFAFILYSIISIIIIIGLNQLKKLNLSNICKLFLVGRMSSNISSVNNPEDKDKISNTNTNTTFNDNSNNTKINDNNTNNTNNSDDLRKFEIIQHGLERYIISGFGLGLAASKGQSPAVRLATDTAAGAVTGATYLGLSHAQQSMKEVDKTKKDAANFDSQQKDNVISKLDKSDDSLLNSDKTQTKNTIINTDTKPSNSLDSPKTPTNESKINDETPSPGSGFINSPLEELINNPNPVEGLLYSILLIHIIVVIFLVIILITFVSKLIFSFDYKFNWLNKIFSEEKSIKIKSFLLKIFNIINKIRNYNIFMYLIILTILSIINLYLYSVFIFDLEYMCKVYLKYLSEKGQ